MLLLLSEDVVLTLDLLSLLLDFSLVSTLSGSALAEVLPILVVCLNLSAVKDGVAVHEARAGRAEGRVRIVELRWASTFALWRVGGASDHFLALLVPALDAWHLLRVVLRLRYLTVVLASGIALRNFSNSRQISFRGEHSSRLLWRLEVVARRRPALLPLLLFRGLVRGEERRLVRPLIFQVSVLENGFRAVCAQRQRPLRRT